MIARRNGPRHLAMNEEGAGGDAIRVRHDEV